MTDKVLYAVSHGVATITLNRPQRLNALDRETIAGLARVSRLAAIDDAARVVVLTGAGRGFCAGGDVKKMATGDLMAGDEASPLEAALNAADALHRAIGNLARLDKPLIAAVNGPAAGAGLTLALVADITWAAAAATFNTSYTSIGLSPDGGTTHFLPRAVGPRMAAELLLTNRTVMAEEAQRIGLCSRVYDDEDLAPAVASLAAGLARGPRRAFASVKALLRSSGTQALEAQLEDERDHLAQAVTGPELAHGAMAFLMKRKPDFSGV